MTRPGGGRGEDRDDRGRDRDVTKATGYRPPCSFLVRSLSVAGGADDTTVPQGSVPRSGALGDPRCSPYADAAASARIASGSGRELDTGRM
jgi:hypothetical protein